MTVGVAVRVERIRLEPHRVWIADFHGTTLRERPLSKGRWKEGGRRLSEEGADCMLFVLQGMMSGADERQERERTDKEMSRY